MEQIVKRIASGIGLRNFKYRENDWSVFSCPLAPYKAEHGYREDRHPSAGMISKNDILIWNCLCCKSKGNVNNLLDTLGGLRKTDYSHLKYECDEVYIPDFDSLNTESFIDVEPFDSYLASLLFESLDNKAIAYIKKRGISLDTAKKLNLLYEPEYGRIVFPITDTKGVIYGYSGRAIDAEPKIFNYGDVPISKFLLGTFPLPKKNPFLVVEGLFAFAKLHELTKDIPFNYNIVALMGSSASKEQIQTMIEYGQNPVYLLLDGDAAGEAGVQRILKLIGDQLPVFKLKYPEGKSDPDELTQEELLAMVRSPLKISVEKRKKK
jgi:hypothetical protein